MARTSTVVRVHSAVLELAAERGPTALTMEGIAARAGVGKQTLYRSWPGIPALLFDALLATGGEPSAPGTADDLPGQLEQMLKAAITEISAEPHASLLRAISAIIQTDESVARDYRERLLEPQLAHVHAVLAAGGSLDPPRAAELLLAPIFYRWFMRLPPLSGPELHRHVHDVLDLIGGTAGG
ncbi:TetR/AcrR family transcriptional regulator [Nocardioides hwasunensis]|uniref:TetR/AcrR family transcriptional regulator n=1 Tax=Nocardioides hwasunensis TaxID=397258 RepID=A0ABR8MBJ0_9ACTN|nr:TetR/AcrR family transcriptional regulator [Nocardioides hwasunensis]MBD3913233.1 TetR/AcrR family transcriptional regulator [Nocardioides hwasunensis]